MPSLDARTLIALSRLLWFVGLPSAIAIAAYTAPITAAISPALLLPTIVAYRLYLRLPVDRGDARWKILGAYLSTASLGTILAVTLQMVHSLIIMAALFSTDFGPYLREFSRSTTAGLTLDDVERRRSMAHSPRHILYLAITSYILAGLLEEGVKYAALRTISYFSPPKHEMEYVVTTAAAGFGFATLEAVGFLHAAVEAGQSGVELAVLVLKRNVFSITMHGLLGCMTGLYAIHRNSRRRRTFLRTIGRAALYHGTIDFIILCTCAYNGEVGWVHPTDLASNAFMILSCMVMLVLASLDIWARLSRMNLRAC